MAEDSKVLSLSNVKILKDYISRNIDTVSSLLKDEYNSQLSSITEQLDILKNNGTLEGVEELRLEMDALQNNFNDKNEALESLRGDLDKLNSDIADGSVFSEGQLNEIIKTALIDKTVITDDMVSTPNVFTQQIVALIGNFGKLSASKIEAGTLKGSNIQSNYKLTGSDEPIWKIDDEGAGWLAKKNIEWDKDGNVNFGPGVKLSWNSMDSDTIPDFATKDDLGSIESGGMTDDEFETKLTNIGPNWIETQYIDASKITGNTISGKTIQSSTNATLNGGGTGPSWKINNDGSGYLAKKNINWNAAGKVTFGSDVELSWGNITGTETITNSISTANSNAANAKALAEQAGSTAASATSKATAASSAIEALNTRVDSLNNYSEDEIKAYATNITKDIITTPSLYALTITADKVTTAALEAESATIGKIAADKVVVKTLNTDPDKGTDKIEISDNHIHCLNDAGKKNLIVSSNTIDSDIASILLGDTAQYDDVEYELAEMPITEHSVKVNNTTYDYTNTVSSNSDAWFNCEEVDEIGYFFKDAELIVQPKLCAFKGRSLLNGYKKVNNEAWLMLGDCFITLYKYDLTDKQWKTLGNEYTNILPPAVNISLINGSTDNISMANNYWSNIHKIIGDEKGYKLYNLDKAKQISKFIIPSDGKYGLKIAFRRTSNDGKTPVNLPYFIVANKKNSRLLDALMATYDLTVSKNTLPATYTEIGKNGMISYDGKNVLCNSESGVTLRSNKSGDPQRFYGIRVDENGIYISNGIKRYRSLEDYINILIDAKLSEHLSAYQHTENTE